MSYRSLNHFIRVLEAAGELVRVGEYVSPRLEITEIADRMVKSNGKAILFENTGTDFPLLINSFASDRRLCLAFGVERLEDIEKEFGELVHTFLGPKKGFLEKLRMLPSLGKVSSWMPKSLNGRGACQEMVMEKPDLNRLPVLTCWPHDGGPFITLPAVHTKDPVTGARNLGMYRMQVFSGDLTGMHWHMHKGSARHYQGYKELGKRMPVTVTLGGDPVYTYAATAPLPENMDEYLLAGFLRRKRVGMVRCLTNELEVPCDVDFVIEGYVDPTEDLISEGPFGDHTGFYSLADYFPKFHVTCITHRRDAVYPATIVGIPPQEDGWIGKATERIFLAPIRLTVAPEVTDMHMPVEGVFHNITLLSLKKTYPGQAPKIMNSLWGAGQMMFNKIMVVTDDPVNLKDYREVARIVSERVDPLTDIHFIHGPVDILDHASPACAYGSKMGIDATLKLPQEKPAGDPAGPESSPDPWQVNRKDILGHFPEIKGINPELPGDGISAIILAVRKTGKDAIRRLARELLSRGYIRHVKFLVFVDEAAGELPLPDIVWISANNIDPARDCFYAGNDRGEDFHTLCIDGTGKSKELDGFQRKWPSVIVMDDKTIGTVDEKWPTLGLGPVVPSPSLKYKRLITSDGAIAREDF